MSLIRLLLSIVRFRSGPMHRIRSVGSEEFQPASRFESSMFFFLFFFQVDTTFGPFFLYIYTLFFGFLHSPWAFSFTAI